MKKLILVLFAFTTLVASAHEPKFSMRKTSETKQISEHVYNSGKSAGAWFLIGGVTLFGGSITKIVANYAAVPDFTSYATVEDYNKANDKYLRNQKSANTAFLSCIGVSGLTFVLGAADLLNTPLVDGQKAALKLKSNASGVGLCLNFK